jgi:hypothetical protein
MTWTNLVQDAHAYASSIKEHEYAASARGVNDILTLFMLTRTAQHASRFFNTLSNFAKAALFLKYLLCVSATSTLYNVLAHTQQGYTNFPKSIDMILEQMNM